VNTTSGRRVAVKQLPEQLSIKQDRGFLHEVEPCLNVDRPHVVFDCSKLQQLDSSGIRVLLSCLESAMKRNGDIKLAAIPPLAAAILELAKVDHLFEAFGSTAEAVDSFYEFPTRSFHHTLRHDHSTLSIRARRNRFEDSRSDSSEGPPASEIAMRTGGRWLRRQIAGCLMLLLVAPLAAAFPPPQQAMIPSQQAEIAASTKTRPKSENSAIEVQAEPSQPETLPNSPGTANSQDQQPSPKLQSEPQEPLGTAAATFIKTTGIAASRPAGAAIAPAKQRRARSILIKVGVIAGAGIAIGTVVALSCGSPSRPAGSR
jgi:anti-anti-sigma factor